MKFISLPVNFFDDPRIIKLGYMAGDFGVLAFMRLCFKAAKDYGKSRDDSFLGKVYDAYPVQEFISIDLKYYGEFQESLIDVFEQAGLIVFDNASLKILFDFTGEPMIGSGIEKINL